MQQTQPLYTVGLLPNWSHSATFQFSELTEELKENDPFLHLQSDYILSLHLFLLVPYSENENLSLGILWRITFSKLILKHANLSLQT